MTYNTEKRNVLLSFLKQNRDKAFSLEEICDSLTEDGKGKSTLYRQTASLVKDGYVSRISVGSRKFVYQYMDRGHCLEHLHLKCLDCGKLLHLDSQISRTFKSALSTSSGFALDDGCILFGKCENCNKKDCL